MAVRKAEVIYVGDAASITRASREAANATGAAEKKITGSHARIGSSFTSMAKRAVAAGVAFGGAYASIAGVKSAISATDDMAASTLKLHRVLGLSVQQASAWAAVAKVHGIDTKALSMAFGTLSKNVLAAQQGSEKQRTAMQALGSTHADVAKKIALVAKGAGAQSQAFKELGITQGDLKKGSTDFQYLLDRLGQGFESLPAGTSKAALAMKLFGRGWQTIVPLMREGAAGMDAQLHEAQAMGATFGGKTVKSLEQFRLAQEKAKYGTLGLQLAIGQYLAPALTKILGGVAKFVSGMRDGTGAGGKFRDVMVAAFDRVRSVVLGTVGVVKTIVGWFEKHQTVAVALAGALGGLAVAMGTVKAVMIAMTVATKAQAVATAILDAVMNANPIVLLGTAIAVVVGVLVALELKTHFVEKAWRALKSAFESVINWIGGAATAAFGLVKKAASDGLLGPVPYIIAHWKDVLKFFEALPGKIVHFFANLPGNLLNIGKNLMLGLLHGIESGVGAVYNAFKGIAKKGVDLLTHPWKIFSPSKVFYDIGGNVTKGLALGIIDGQGTITDAANRGLLYPIDQAITALEARKQKLQDTWQAIDNAAQRASLVAAVGAARRNETSAKQTASLRAIGGGGGVAGTVIGVGRKMGATPKQILAAIETGIVESGLKNLKYGDADSLGFRQERTSIYGKKHATSVVLSAQDFYREAKALDRSGLSAGDLAAAVQRPAAQFRGRYGQVKSQALRVIGGRAGTKFRAVGGSVVGGDGASVAQAIQQLKDFDKQAQRAKTLATIDLKVRNLTALKAFKDAISGISSQVHDLAGQAAQAWRAIQEKAINSTHDAAIAAIGDSADAQELAGLQTKDAQEQDAKTTAQLNQDLQDAMASGDKKAINDAQDAIADYARQKREDELTENLANAQKKADDAQQTALDGLDQQTADYQAGLDKQFDVLTAQLAQRKITYATWAKDVNGILAGYGLSVSTDPSTEATVAGGPSATQGGSTGATGGSYKPAGHGTVVLYDANGHATGFAAAPAEGWTYDVSSTGQVDGLHPRATGGPVSRGGLYLIGERGPEIFAPNSPGQVIPNDRIGGMGGGDVHVHGDMIVNNRRDADRLAAKLAFRLAHQ